MKRRKKDKEKPKASAYERFYSNMRMKIVGAFFGMTIVVVIFWSAMYSVVAYAADGLHRDDTRDELLEDLHHIVEMLEAAHAEPASAAQANLITLNARQLNATIALQSGNEQWNIYGEGADRLRKQLSTTGSDEWYHYRWNNPFTTRDAVLMTTVQGSDGTSYRLAINKPLAAWYDHFYYAVSPQLLFVLTIALLALFATPWRKQMQLMKMMLDAMSRIASGDFAVELPKVNRSGDMEVIVEGLSDMATELQQLEQTRQRFISDVSHELQSPLTSITGFARALHNETLSKETRLDYLERIEAESMRLSKLSDSLLKLTMLEAQREIMEPCSYELDMQLKRTALALEPQWLGKRIELDIDLEHATVTGDEDALRQVWTNLLHNAIKFTPEDGTIRIQLKKEQQHAFVTIADTGIGIAEEDLPHVFERFYKADKARTSSKGGSGLGLAIAATIVRQHGGTINASSVQGQGTTFEVTIPLQPAAAEKLGKPTESKNGR
ncbi:signal transduction histidine kinase [Paenibacillus cellulosilyticus]|uniref:histidine kinase n=1 Tax=Paenibacillus cellulosilyticus TaxID=375489 RepID=A0A2V2YZT9_9BACL|nr:HAMP domain-containing sensor histidine kinase [Paenibacillus cellulosilyticus]PWW08528.1 signal transduction histidine kinase [Paenibacillus cellulosilyticus]QKS48107.1 sensor histidine kinase [Paenibacillus cellulosilyticus]